MSSTDTRRLSVSEMDFDEIKTNLKNYLRGQTTLTDYDFEGSAVSTMLDAMAYLTHMNAVNANFSLNEAYLDSAQVRSSVVSHAKLLGYTPRSAYAPTAYVDVLFNSPINVGNATDGWLPLVMPKNTLFKSIIDGVSYNFVTEQTLSTTIDDDGEFKFSQVKLIQGTPRYIEYVFDVDSAEAFIIPFENVVTSTISVSVKPNDESSEMDSYALAPNVVNINDESKVYFLQEGVNGFYEIQFGDNIFGKALENGNIIRIDCVVTDVEEANGASKFSLNDAVQNNTNATVTTIQKATGGSPREDIESIKFNAPLGYVSQNRAVTPDDYKTIINNTYANVDAIAVWGGEDADPPDYGKVYISIKPKDAEVVPDLDKDLIISQYLKPKNVVSITPVLVDPTYTYIDMEVYFKYNPNITSLNQDALQEAVREEIRLYNTNDLTRFDGVFRYSNVLQTIDGTDPSIVSSYAYLFMKKRFVPVLNKETQYELVFSAPIYQTAKDISVIKSSLFVYRAATCYLADKLIDGERIIQAIRVSDGVVLNNDLGYVDTANGKVVLEGFAPTSFTGEYIEITVQPDSYDIAPKRNELLQIAVDELEITGTVDTMITGGTSAGVNYNTTSRQ